MMLGVTLYPVKTSPYWSLQTCMIKNLHKLETKEKSSKFYGGIN